MNEDTLFILAVALVIIVVVIVGAFLVDKILQYNIQVEQELCAPKMILPNGTKICK